MPAAIGPNADEYVGNDGLNGFGTERKAGLWLQAAYLLDHVVNIGGVDAAKLGQCGRVATRHKVKAAQERGNGGVVAVLGPELDREAFGEIARANTDRFEALHNAENLFDDFDLDTQPSGEFTKI